MTILRIYQDDQSIQDFVGVPDHYIKRITDELEKMTFPDYYLQLQKQKERERLTDREDNKI